jgi:protein TonB
MTFAACLSFAAVAGEEPEQPEPAMDDRIGVVPPQIILASQKAPEYPPAALAARFTGTVKVMAEVLPDGSVGKVEIVECTHKNVGFEEAAIEAVKKWRFEPALKDGSPTDYMAQFRLNFKSAGPGSGFMPFVSSGFADPGSGKSTRSDRSTSSRSSSTSSSQGDKGSQSSNDRDD